MNANRDKGHRFERRIINELKEFGYQAVSSRSESKSMDDKGVDIISDFPFYIQCKNTMRMPEPWKIFDKMPKEKPPLIVWTKNHKEDLVIIRKTDFYELIKQVNGYEVSGKEGD